MDITQKLAAFRQGQPIEGRRLDLSAENAQGHAQRITDIYTRLEGYDDQPGQDTWSGKGRVIHSNGTETHTLTYTGDTQNGTASSTLNSPGTTVTQETVFSPDSIDQVSVSKGWRGTSTFYFHLDRANPGESFQIIA